MVKSNYQKRICYDEEFAPTMSQFLEFIESDEMIDKLVLRNKSQRFSATIRELIKWYIGRRKKELLKKEGNKENEPKQKEQNPIIISS